MKQRRGGAPEILYRKDLAKKERLPFVLYCGTALPLVVAITNIGVASAGMSVEIATAMVGAAVLSVMVFPAAAEAPSACEHTERADGGEFNRDAELASRIVLTCRRSLVRVQVRPLCFSSTRAGSAAALIGGSSPAACEGRRTGPAVQCASAAIRNRAAMRVLEVAIGRHATEATADGACTGAGGLDQRIVTGQTNRKPEGLGHCRVARY